MSIERQPEPTAPEGVSDSGARTVTGIRPAPRRPETQPPTQLTPAALRPARVPRPAMVPPALPARPEPDAAPVPEHALTEGRVKALEASLRAARARFERGLGEIDALRERLDERESLLGARLTEVSQRLMDLEARVASLHGSRDRLAGELRGHRVDIYLERLAQASRLEGLEHRLDVLEEGAELARVRMRLDGMAARVDAVAGGAAALEARVEHLEEGPELARLRMRLDRIGHRIDALERDDLTRIEGVGQRYAEALRTVGVRTLAQLAAWTDADVARAAERLGVAPSRVRAWVARAAELAKG